MAVFAGLDWGNFKIAMATWDAVARRPQMLAADGAKFLPADIGFEVDDRRNAIAVYPANDSVDCLLFIDLKRKLTAFRDAAVAQFVVESLLKKWRTRIADSDVHCSISVPVDYSIRQCEIVQQAGLNAGFASCSYVNEALAAVLACIPGIIEDATKWRLLEGGRTVWVLDCGSVDLNLALIHVGRVDESLNFSFLAGDCLEELGSSLSGSADANTESVNRQFDESFPNMVEAAFGRAWPNWVGVRPELRKADWVIPVGGGANLNRALDALKRQIPDIQILGRNLESAEVVALGTCVHAAIQNGQVPYRIGVVRRRMVLGLRSDTGDNRFIPISRPQDEVPFTFERAFALPDRTGNEAEVEITLAAAFPGGDRFGGIATCVLDRRKVSATEHPVLLLRGAMDSWEGGTVELYEMGSGTKLWEAPFQLP
jgi:molecular chaperone DnaK (HSP70)